MTTIRAARTIVGALITTAGLGACAGQGGDYIDAAAIDRSCTIGAQDKLRRLAHLEPEDVRSLTIDRNKPYDRMVEIDTTNGKLNVTYVFLCVTNREGYVSVSSIGIR